MNINEIIANNKKFSSSFMVSDFSTVENLFLLGYPFSPKDLSKNSKKTLNLDDWNTLQSSFRFNIYDLPLYFIKEKSNNEIKYLFSKINHKINSENYYSLACTALSNGNYEIFLFLKNLSNNEIIKKNNNLVVFVACVFSSNLSYNEKISIIKKLENFQISYDQNNIFAIWANVCKNTESFDYFYNKLSNSKNIKLKIYRGLNRYLIYTNIKDVINKGFLQIDDPILIHIRTLFEKQFNTKLFYLSFFNSLINITNLYSNVDLKKKLTLEINRFLIENQNYANAFLKIKDPIVHKICLSISLHKNLKKFCKNDSFFSKKNKI